MRITVLVGGAIGFLVALGYTLCVMEHRPGGIGPPWVVAATFRPGPGDRSVVHFLIVSAILPVLFGGLAGDLRWTRRSITTGIVGGLLAGVIAWVVFSGLVTQHGRAGANTRGALILDALFAGGYVGAYLGARWRPGDLQRKKAGS